MDGKPTSVTITNKKFSGILIHKTDSTTGKGIYGVTFLLYDSTNKPIGQYTTDNNGYIYIEDLTVTGKYFLKEMENKGYIIDTEMKTVYCTVLSGLTGGTQFVNQADVGGVYNGQWIMDTDRWVTTVYATSKPLPRTGY